MPTKKTRFILRSQKRFSSDFMSGNINTANSLVQPEPISPRYYDMIRAEIGFEYWGGGEAIDNSYTNITNFHNLPIHFHKSGGRGLVPPSLNYG
jgi:hypothetical protein